MINKQEEQTIVRKGTLEEKTFSIEATPEAFEILSSGLYSDTQAAVLRELGTNCLDAHVFNNNPDPFEVNLPTSWNSTLRFRDFGPGLSEQEVNDIYTSYFTSTKNNSNKYVGALGLGSKSPMSLTDSFTVASFQAGKKITYTVFKNEKNIPSITKLSEENTTEKSGLEILISVPRTNISSYQSKAAQIYRWFKNKPKITPALIYPTDTVLIEEKDWKVVKQTEFIAVMGSVAYPIDFTLLDPKYKAKFINYNSPGVHLFFEIGDLDIAASREKLQYTNKTKLALSVKLDLIIDNAVKLLEKEIQGAKNRFEAGVIAKTKINNLTQGANLVFQGKTLNTGHISVKDFTTFYLYRSKLRENDLVYVEPTVFYYNDLDRGGPSRFKEFVQSNGTNAKLFQNPQNKPIQELLDQLGINDGDLIRASTLPKVSVIRTGHGKTEKVLKFTGGGRNVGYRNWENAVVNVSDTIHYIPIVRFNPVVKGKEVSHSYIDGLKSFLIQYKLMPNVDIYGVRNSFSKRGRKNWVNIAQLFEDNFEKLKQSEKIQELFDKERKYDNEKYNMSYEMKYLKGVKHPDIEKIITEWESLEKEIVSNKNILFLWKNAALMYGVTIEGKDERFSLDTFYAKKPLCKFIEKSSWSEQEVLKYLAL